MCSSCMYAQNKNHNKNIQLIRDAFMYAQKQIKQNKKQIKRIMYTCCIFFKMQYAHRFVCMFKLFVCMFTYMHIYACFNPLRFASYAQAIPLPTHIFNIVPPCIQAFPTFIRTLCFRAISYVLFAHIQCTYVLLLQTQKRVLSVFIYMPLTHLK